MLRLLEFFLQFVQTCNFFWPLHSHYMKFSRANNKNVTYLVENSCYTEEDIT